MCGDHYPISGPAETAAFPAAKRYASHLPAGVRHHIFWAMSAGKPIVPATGSLAAGERSSATDVEAFVKTARALGPGRAGGRLVLALDATMSRQPTWDLACMLQAEMFDAASRSGRLAVQLVYFRGAGECRASAFAADTDALKRLMSAIDCRGGSTQIGKVLAHVLREAGRGKVDAVVYIGDAMEEDAGDLAGKAAQLGIRGVPVFVFQEGGNAVAEQAFREIARLSRGAWFRFDRNAAAMLAKLLSAAALYASGGLTALEARGRPEDRMMIEHMRGGKAR